MASEVQICSDALGQLGESPIMSMDDDTKAARLCKRFYYDLRDAVLRAYPWKCAIAYQALSILTGASAITGSKYTYTYQLPVNPFCLRPLIINEADEDFSIAWERVGNKIITNESTVTLKYIKRIVDPGEYDALLIDAIIARLAQVLAYPITGDKKMGEAAWQLYREKISEARSIDSMEGSTVELTQDDLLSVRY
jgi:hypothetical protein